MHLERSIGLVGLTFGALSGTLGAGWPFVPMFVSQLAGPAGIISWLVGGFVVLLIAVRYAEIGAMLSVAGGLARVPWFSHGNVVGAVIGWSAWVGYAAMAPIDVLVILKCLRPAMPFVAAERSTASDFDLSLAGDAVAIALLVSMVFINAIGVRFLAAVNTSLTWINLAVPIVVTAVIVSFDRHADNLTHLLQRVLLEC